MRLTFQAFGLMIDLRLISYNGMGWSLVYARCDVGTRTIVQLDVERVAKEWRDKPLEALAQCGPWRATNRSHYYV